MKMLVNKIFELNFILMWLIVKVLHTSNDFMLFFSSFSPSDFHFQCDVSIYNTDKDRKESQLKEVFTNLSRFTFLYKVESRSGIFVLRLFLLRVIFIGNSEETLTFDRLFTKFYVIWLLNSPMKKMKGLLNDQTTVKSYSFIDAHTRGNP